MSSQHSDRNDSAASGQEPESPSEALDKKKGTLATLQDMLDKHKDQIAVALPRHLTAERMIRVALTAVSRSPLLQKCDPRTIAGCLVQSSLLGLECDGALGEGYLIPFWNSKANGKRGGYECQFVPGYQGLIKLVRNTDQLVMIDAQPVYENDHFEYEYGLDPKLVHRVPKPTKPGDKGVMRGELVAYWAGATLKGGGKQFAVMTMEELEEHRDRYSKGAYDRNDKLTGAWRDSPDWMYRKTVLKQLVKLLPKSAQAQAAVALDDAFEAGKSQRFTSDVPMDFQPTSDEEDDAETTARMRDETRKTGEELKDKLTKKGEETEGGGDKGTKKGRGSKARPADSKDSPPENPASNEGLSDKPPADAEPTAATPPPPDAPDDYPKFTGDAEAKSLGDSCSPEDLQAVYLVAKRAQLIPSKACQSRYGCNPDELSKAAMADFKGFLEFTAKRVESAQ